jgi:hypothetical protein
MTFAIGGERHCELSAARRGGGERLAIEEGCSNVVGRHGLRSEGSACEEECACDGECSCAHPKSPGTTDAS